MIFLVFASANAHKVNEMRQLMAHLPIQLLSLTDIHWTTDIPETADTLEGNAFLKAKTIAEAVELACFADDTGLEVASLDGRPGVYSARYAGEPTNADNNRVKLLQEMSGKKDRKARFRTSICLILKGKTYYFDGEVNGEILENEQGSGGFGYDSLFLPEGYTTSFAEMAAAEKNSISHRGRAVQQMLAALPDLLNG
jgi:XTP/dITP diphosphohydrolase